MDIDNLSPEQMEKVFRLCDVMSLEDIYVATTILQTYGWDVQKAIDEIVYSKQQENKPQPSKAQQQQPNNNYKKINGIQPNAPIGNNKPSDYVNLEDEDPYMIHDQQFQEDMIDYQNFEYDYPENDLQNKKKMFEENYVSELPLVKTVSETLVPLSGLEKDRLLAKDFRFHRQQYQTSLLERSELFCNSILESKSSDNSRGLYKVNQQKIFNNKKFIVYLHKVYKSRINFTFGTFMLNLIRSHLDEKYLVVFILHEDLVSSGQKVVEKILTQPEFARFVNANCISYGMFDNSDDYEIVQKYVPLKDLPVFAIFRYNKKDRKEQFIGSYPLLSSESENCLQWMAKSMGIPLKKKQQQKKSEQMIPQEPVEYEKISDILKEQNLQYEEIEKLYHMKRNESRVNKEKIRERQLMIEEMRKRFQETSEPEFVSGKTIQIKFRMPISGDSKMRVFDLAEKVQTLFDYIEAYCQQQFEQPFCEFDLTQTFPMLSLKDKKELKIGEIFQESDRQNIIVREI